MPRSSSLAIAACAICLAAGAAVASSAPKLPAWAIGPFVRPVQGPVITPDPRALFEDPIRKAPVHWEALHTFNPAAVVRDGKVDVLYRAEDDTGAMQIGMHTSRLGLAESTDGIHFTRRPEPVFYPADDAQKNREWPGGVEDPRLVEGEDGTYVLTYTQWNRETYSVGIATSRDLLHWTKYGPAFGSAPGGKYSNLKYKSAGMVTRLVGDRLVAAKVKGKYWMYWGEGEIHLATSPDLIHWTPVEDAHGQPLVLLRKRPGHFDSSFPEVGPPPVLTDKGIVVIYNGKNAAGTNGKNAAGGNAKNTSGANSEDESAGDPDLGANAYAAGEALFAADDPSHLLARLEKPFFKPEMPFEKTGQYAAGTTFVEGLVRFSGKWFLYYGCADSMVGVATSQ